MVLLEKSELVIFARVQSIIQGVGLIYLFPQDTNYLGRLGLIQEFFAAVLT